MDSAIDGNVQRTACNDKHKHIFPKNLAGAAMVTLYKDTYFLNGSSQFLPLVSRGEVGPSPRGRPERTNFKEMFLKSLAGI